MSACAVVHVCAVNDRSGNPRRLYLLIHPIQGAVAAIDEEFAGTRCLVNDPDAEALRAFLGHPGALGDAVTLSVHPAEYHSLLKGYGPGAPKRKEALEALRKERS